MSEQKPLNTLGGKAQHAGPHRLVCEGFLRVTTST